MPCQPLHGAAKPAHPANTTDQAAAGAPGREGRRGKVFSRCKTPDLAGTWHHAQHQAKHQAERAGNLPALVWTGLSPVNRPTGDKSQPGGDKKSQVNQGLAILSPVSPVSPVQKAGRRCARPPDPAAKPPSQGPPDRLPAWAMPPAWGHPLGVGLGVPPTPRQWVLMAHLARGLCWPRSPAS